MGQEIEGEGPGTDLKEEGRAGSDLTEGEGLGDDLKEGEMGQEVT